MIIIRRIIVTTFNRKALGNKRIERGKPGGGVVCLLVAQRPSNMRVYLRDGSAQTIVRAATLRQKLQIQLSTSPSHSILTPGRPVPALTL